MKILYFMTPAYGHTIPVLPIIRELTVRGHDITCVNAPEFAQRLMECGADVLEYPESFCHLQLEKITEDLSVLAENLIELNERLYDIYLDQVREMMPDLILYDSMLSFAKNLACHYQIRHICLVSTIGFNLPVCLFSHIALSSLPLVLQTGRKLKNLVRQDRAFRKDRGLQGFRMIDLFMNRGDETLVLTPRKLQPLAWTFPKNVHFVGSTVKDQIQMFHEQTYEAYDYYISMGTIFTDQVQNLRAFLEQPEIRNSKVIISTCNVPDWMGAMPNVRTEKWVSNVDLIPNIRWFINVGGAGSVYLAMYYGVPQVCIPVQEEQRCNSKIVERHKAGFCLKQYDTEKLNRALMGRNRLKPEQCQQIIREADGTAEAVRWIEGSI